MHQLQHAAVFVVTEYRRLIAVFLIGDHLLGTRRPAQAGGIQPLAFTPFQSIKPAGGRRGLTIGLGVQGLVFVVDNEIVGTGSGQCDHLGGDGGIQLPAFAGAGPAVGGAKFTRRQQLDAVVGSDELGGENGEIRFHAAILRSGHRGDKLTGVSGFRIHAASIGGKLARGF